MMFGWYYDGGRVQDTGGDLWQLIGSAVEEGPEAIHRILVGPMVDLAGSDLVDSDDAESIFEDCEGCPTRALDRIVELAKERADERVYDGTCTLSGSSTYACQALAEWYAARGQPGESEAFASWADAYLSPDPSCYCNGGRAMPVELVGGEWRHGDSDHEIEAVVSYATMPSPETGHVGWVWWARGRMGDASSLPEAMRKAEEALRR